MTSAAPPRDRQMTWEQSVRPKGAIHSWLCKGLLAWQGASALASRFILLHAGSPHLKGGGSSFVPSRLLRRLCWRGAMGSPSWAPRVGSWCHPLAGLSFQAGVREAASLRRVKTCSKSLIIYMNRKMAKSIKLSWQHLAPWSWLVLRRHRGAGSAGGVFAVRREVLLGLGPVRVGKRRPGGRTWSC